VPLRHSRSSDGGGTTPIAGRLSRCVCQAVRRTGMCVHRWLIGSRGRFCHSAMPLMTFSVSVEIVCRDTCAP
jgi:hypothetical protein